MTPKPPASLVRYVRNGRCVLFCGSGLSAWAKLPTWRKLLEEIVKQLADELPDDTNLEELHRLLEAGKLLEVADHCKEALGRRYNDILSEHLRGATGEIPAPHKVIVRVPFAAVVTTNYDKLLERSYANEGNLPKTPTHRDVDALGPLLFDGSFFILKAHGDIDRPEGMVLTTRDYQEIIHANPAFNAIFSAILLTKAVLFVGYSLNDPDFRLLLDRQLTIFGANVPDRYALMTGVGKVERDVLWRTAKIRVLSYDDGKHEQVLEFLQMLLDQVGAEPAVATSPAPIVTPVPPTPPRVAPVAPAFVEAVARVAPGPVALGAAFELRRSAPHAEAVPAHAGGSATASTLLSVRLRGRTLEATLSSGDDTAHASGRLPNWAKLTKAMPDALRDQAQARALGKELAKLLPEAVVTALKAVPADHVITLRLSAEIEWLPWEMTEIDGQFLVLRNPLVRAPVGVSDSARGYPIVRKPVRVLLIGDPNQDDGAALPGALAEVTEIAKLYVAHPAVVCDAFTGAQADFDSVAAALSSGGYDIVHFAGHAWFDEDLEPFLMLSRMVKLRSTEFRSLISPRPPAILILNSHFTIFAPPGGFGEDVKKAAEEGVKPAPGGQRGFIEAASTAGVGVLIGSYSGALDDTIAQRVGVSLHEALLKGEPVARALHQSLLRSESAKADANASHLTYAMSGYGDIALPL